MLVSFEQGTETPVLSLSCHWSLELSSEQCTLNKQAQGAVSRQLTREDGVTCLLPVDQSICSLNALPSIRSKRNKTQIEWSWEQDQAGAGTRHTFW